MARLKKILYWSVGILIISGITLSLLAPILIDTNALKEEIKYRVLSKTGLTLELERIDLSLFPRLHLTVHNSTVSHELINGTIESLSITPELIPLLYGNIQGTDIVISSPDVSLDLKESNAAPNGKGIPPLDAINEALAALYAPLLHAHGINLLLQDGSFRMSKKGKAMIILNTIRAKIESPSGEIRLELQSSSDIYEHMKLTLSSATDGSRAKCGLELSGLNVHSILERIPEVNPDKMPDLTLDMEMECEAAEGHSAVSIKELSADGLDFRFNAALDIESNPPQAGFSIKGGKLDVDEVRERLLLMAGDNPVVRIVFDILRSGYVPSISLSSSGSSIAELFKFKNMFINGDLIDGILAIPGSATELKPVRGEVIISNGVIEGVSVEAGVDKIENLTLPSPLKLKASRVSYGRPVLALNDLGGDMGSSTIAGVNLKMDFKKKLLSVASGNALLDLKEMHAWLSTLDSMSEISKRVSDVKGTISLSVMDMEGPITKPSEWEYRVTGSPDGIELVTSLFPERLLIDKGSFMAYRNDFEFLHVETEIMDAVFDISGRIPDYLEGIFGAEITLSGKAGERSLDYASRLANLPPDLKPLAPMILTDTRLVLKDERMSLSGNVEVQGKVKIVADIVKDKKEFIINKLSVIDDESNASISAHMRNSGHDLAFNGFLSGSTVDSLIAGNRFMSGWLRGDLKAYVLKDNITDSTVHGELEGQGINLPLLSNVPMKIKGFLLDASGSNVQIRTNGRVWEDKQFSLEGRVKASSEKLSVNADVVVDGIEWDDLQKLNEADAPEKDVAVQGTPPVEANVKIDAGYFTYGKFTFKPVHVDMSYEKDMLNAVIYETELCGISMDARFNNEGDVMFFDAQPAAENKDLEHSLACLLDTEKQMSGTYKLNGNITGAGTKDTLKESLNGEFEFIATDGRIYKMTMLSKILALLNVTEIYRGVLPTDILKEGLAYRSLSVKGELKDSVMIINEVILDGTSLEIYAQGRINLMDRKSDIDVMVSPFKTTDAIVKMIPVLRDIVGGTLIAIPMKVTGDISDPKITYLPVEAVGSRLLDIMKNTIQAPFKILEPVFPKTEK